MFSPNELNSPYGRECRQRQAFWDNLGIPKKQRTKFARHHGYTAASFAETFSGFDPGYLIDEYEKYKKEKEQENMKKMAGFDIESNSHFVNSSPIALTVDHVDWSGQWNLRETGWEFSSPSMTQLQKEEETMSDNYEQRRYLETRLTSAHREHAGELEKHFNIYGGYPKTLNEAVDLIKAGKFEINQKKVDAYNNSMGCFDDEPNAYGYDNYSFAETIKFDVPQPDKEGFKAAEKLLGKAYTDAKDQIKVLDIEAGLKALKDFESSDFTVH
jgi:hypothetical protein